MLYGDLHTHTAASGHGGDSRATIFSMAGTASSKGVPFLGISDHGPATPGSAKESYFRSLALAPRTRSRIPVFYGAEVNILNIRGELDLNDRISASLDYVIASLHPQNIPSGTTEENTLACIRAMANPCVDILGHPDDSHYPLDYKTLVKEAKQHQVALEINNASLAPGSYRPNAWENCRKLLLYCMHYEHFVILGSDSHGTSQIGEFGYALQLIKEMQFPSKWILNMPEHQCRSDERIRKIFG